MSSQVSHSYLSPLPESISNPLNREISNLCALCWTAPQLLFISYSLTVSDSGHAWAFWFSEWRGVAVESASPHLLARLTTSQYLFSLVRVTSTGPVPFNSHHTSSSHFGNRQGRSKGKTQARLPQNPLTICSYNHKCFIWL